MASPIKALEDRPQISLWKRFLIEMSKELTVAELNQAKFAVTEKAIGQGGFEDIKDAETFFNTLETKGYIDEDDTSYLEDIFKSIGVIHVLTELEQYKKERQEYRKRRREIDKRPGAVFIGREGYLEVIMKILDKSLETITCVCICGMAGMGKTELAMEVCARKECRAYYVNLREVKSPRDMILELLTSVGKNVTIDNAQFSIVRDWCVSCKIDTILLIDNADNILEPGSYTCDDFHNTLYELLEVKNSRLKVVITSRYALREARFGSLSFKQVELKPFKEYESIALLQKLAGADRVPDSDAAELATLTGNMPLALRIIASRLVDGGVTAQEIIMQLNPEKGRTMKTLTYRYQPVDQCLQYVFQALPDELQRAWLKLSVFPSTLDQAAATGVIGTGDEAMTKLEIIQPLVNLWKVVNSEPTVEFRNLRLHKVEKYSLHPLVRSFLHEMAKDENLQNSYDQGQRNYVNYYDQLLCQNASKVETDYHSVMQLVLKNNRTNLDHYLKLMVKLGIVPEIESKKDHRKRMSITLLFEHYLGPNRRIELFHNFAEITKKQGKQIKYCFMRALEADSYMPLAHAHKALQILQEPFKILADLASKGESSSNYDLTLAACEYVQGRSLVMIREVQDGIKMLKKSLETRKKLLKKHTYVARNLNAIGHSYFSIKEIDKSLKYHKQAVEVLYSVATKGIHLDMPTFILNVGTCYHWMGNKAHEDGNKEDGNDFYNKALAEYDKAIILEKDMRIYGFPKTAVVLKNKALTYTEMKEFDKALTLAMEAMEIRMQYLGKEHPDTARSVYFVGSIYLSQGDVARNKAAEKESAEEREKSDRLYNIAHNYLKQALEIELSLEPPRRSIDYENTQSDLKKVLKSLQRHAEIDSYEAVFLKANTEKITTGSDGHDDSSSSSNSGSSESDSEKEDNTMKQKAS